jgi:hypothetical protein
MAKFNRHDSSNKRKNRHKFLSKEGYEKKVHQVGAYSRNYKNNRERDKEYYEECDISVHDNFEGS